jgi:hypothetical protein
MNVEIGAEAPQFPEKEYINGIAFAVYISKLCKKSLFGQKNGLTANGANVIIWDEMFIIWR